MIGRCEEVLLRANYPCGGGVAGEGRWGVSTKTNVSGKEACVDHGFKIPFVACGEDVDAGPEADQLAASWTFVQIEGEAPRWVVVPLEGGGFVRARVKENE